MKQYNLKNKNIAVLSSLEDHDLCAKVCHSLADQGATVHVITDDGTMPHDCGADKAIAVDQAEASPYQSLVALADTPGRSKLAAKPKTKQFVSRFFEEKKPVASNCGGTLLAGDFGLIDGRKVSIADEHREEAMRLGAKVAGNPMTVDDGFTTASPRIDLPDFLEKIAEEAEEGKHAGQHA